MLRGGETMWWQQKYIGIIIVIIIIITTATIIMFVSFIQQIASKGQHSWFPSFLPVTYTIYLCVRYTNDTTAHRVGWRFSKANIFCFVLPFQYQKISTSHPRHSPRGRPTALRSMTSSMICFVASQMWVAIRLCVCVLQCVSGAKFLWL